MMTRGHYVQKDTWLSYWNGGAVSEKAHLWLSFVKLAKAMDSNHEIL